MRLLILAVLGCIASQAFGSPSNRQKFDTFNGFDDYMTDGDYEPYYPKETRDDDDGWLNGVYDREETLVPQDPNSVYPTEDRLAWDDDYEDEQSGWYSDDEDAAKDFDSSEFSDESRSDESESSESDSYESDEYDSEEYEDYIEDQIDYIQEDVQFNEDRIYEIEDDLDYDESKIERMDKRLRKLNKRLNSLQDLVNEMEIQQLQNKQKPYKREKAFDYY